MKITGLRLVEVAASRRGNWIFVLVDTDAGITGLGEASQSGNDGLARAVLEQLGEQLQGQDPTQPEVVWERVGRSRAVFSGGAGRVGATAVSAVDQALWDLAGKALGVPVWRLLGGRRRSRVRLYANLNRGTEDRTPDGFAGAAERAVEAGFRAVKATPFDEVSYQSFDRDGVEADVDRGVARLAATRRAIGPEVELMVDCHCRFDLSVAQQVVEKVRDLNLYWLEEPVPRDQVDALAHLTRHAGLTIAGGESLFGRQGFWEYVTRRAVHIIMPDVKHAGGITECRRIAALAEVMQIPVAPHSPAGPVSTVAGAHLAATIQNFLVLEYAFGEVSWRGDLIRPPERVLDGFIEVPETPGLGIELDEAVAAAHRV
ncbi:MAG: mandelate racemase/muconate lactonizing enzyme family protein [Gemmatimonadota bacterium]